MKTPPKISENNSPELLFLHALPLDGTMWDEQIKHFRNASYAPNLYRLGINLEEWAHGALQFVHSDKIVIVGCSVGGSCALQIAKIAPERVAALVLIGTKAVCNQDPEMHQASLDLISETGIGAAWDAFWYPLFSPKSDAGAVAQGKLITMRQSVEDIRNGITVFHTRPNRDDVLMTFKGPIIFMSGSDDSAPGLTRSAKQAGSALNAVLEIVPNCGHYIPLEAPKHLNRILDSLLGQL